MKNSLDELHRAKNRLLYDKGEAEREVSVARDMIPGNQVLRLLAEKTCAQAHARRNMELVRAGAVTSVRFIMNMKERGFINYRELVTNPDYVDCCHGKNVKRAAKCLELCRTQMHLAGEPDVSALADLEGFLKYEITLEEIGTDENEMGFFRTNAECSQAKKLLGVWRGRGVREDWLFFYQKSLSVISLFNLKPDSFFERLGMSVEEIQKFSGK